MKKIFVASVLSIAAVTAHAIPLLDFDGFADGAQVLDYYAGGADSTGRIGPNYGVHFQGGTIQNNSQGGYLLGGFTVSFDGAAIAAGRDYFRSTVLATRWDIDGAHSFQRDEQGRIVDAIWVAGTQHPYCNSKASCDARGSTYYDHETLFGYTFNVFPEVTNISFTAHALDELWLDALTTVQSIRWSDALSGGAGVPKDPDPTGEVPEPTTWMVFLAGMLALGWSRRAVS